MADVQINIVIITTMIDVQIGIVISTTIVYLWFILLTIVVITK